VIENKAGANGIIGVTFVAKSAPDGYTLLMTTGSFTANAAVDPKVPYSALTDFAPVTLVAESYRLALMTRPDFPAKSLAEFVALARRNPGKYSYGHACVGKANLCCRRTVPEARRRRTAQGALSRGTRRWT